jgi:hypothetical protein
MAKGYLIGDAFKDKIKSTIARVEGMVDGGGPTKIETRFESMPRAAGSAVKVCTFTGAWSINGTKTVTLRGVTATLSAVNLFSDVSVNCGTRNCAVARDGTAWYLIAAQCS